MECRAGPGRKAGGPADEPLSGPVLQHTDALERCGYRQRRYRRADSDEASDAWAEPYDRGIVMPAPKIGDGTGSTPTLMGFGPDEDKLVVITDGAKKMRLVAFWRDAIPTGAKERAGVPSARTVDQIEVDVGPGIEIVQSEQSVATYGDYAFVVNNIL